MTRAIALLAFTVAAAAAFAAPTLTTPPEFPSSIAGAGWFQITNYAVDGGPGGIGASYRSNRLKADLYLYDAGDPSWANKPLEERFVRELASIPSVMQEMERRGHYTGVKLTPAKDAKAGDLTFSHLRITYAERNVQKKSDFYLAPYRGRLLKIRLTADEPIDDDSLARAFAEAAAGFAGKS